MATSQMELTVVGTKDRTIMIEAGAKEVKEEIMLEAIRRGQEEMQPAIELINKFKKLLAPKKKPKKSVCFPPIRLPKTKKKIKSSPRPTLGSRKT